MKKQKIFYSDYKPTNVTVTKAKKVLNDLYKQSKQTKICSSCHKDNFAFSRADECFVCSNSDCRQPIKILDPIYGCRLNLVQIELLLCMIIDMQTIEEIFIKTKISRPILKRWQNRFIEQIDWTKYKLDKDLLDVREVYASLSWSKN